MLVILLVTRETVFRSRSEVGQLVCSNMALVTFHARMLSIQFERKAVVIESLAKSIRAVMTAETIRAVSSQMKLYETSIVLIMTIQADSLIESSDVDRVTILTSKRGTIEISLVAVQGKTQHFVRELLSGHIHQ